MQEELVKVCSLNEDTTGSNIYAALESVNHDYEDIKNVHVS